MPEQERTQSPDERASMLGAATTTFSHLCEMCQSIFHLAGTLRHGWHQVMDFHTRGQLDRSVVEERCHLCCKFQGVIAKRETSDRPIAASNLLRVQIRRHKDTGFSLILNRGSARHSALGYIALWLKDAYGIQLPTMSLSTNTQSEDSWAQITSWISSCANDHPRCQSVREHRSSSPALISEMPQRLLAVGNVGDLQVKMSEVQGIASVTLPVPLYTTLSHRWGDIESIRLLNENYQTFLQGIQFEELPQTFKDAVTITRKLGVPYIWIDSLCIIQDSTSDWEIESAKMHQVYRSSFPNICAPAAIDARGGLCYARDPLSTIPCVIQTGADENNQLLVSGYGTDHLSEESEILKRGWVFQELALAPRALFFAREELYWRCYDLEASETMPAGIHHYTYEPRDSHNPQDSQAPKSSLYHRLTRLPTESNSGRWDAWCGLVGEYSGKRLTRFSDKLVAIAGLAAEFGQAWDKMTYLSGLWSFRLRQGLLWRTTEHGLPQLLAYTAPSWSWASVDSKAYQPNSDRYVHSEGLAEVLDARVDPATATDPYGQVKRGSIRLEGPLLLESLVSLSTAQTVPSGWVAELDAGESSFAAEFGILKEVPINLRWDDRAMSKLIRAAKVVLAPLEIVLNKSGIELEGLVLTPTHSKENEYRRLGYFSVEDDWRRKPDFSAIGEPEVDDSEPEVVDSETKRIMTAGEVAVIIADYERQTKLDDKDPRLEAMKTRMAATTRGSNRFPRGDPYHDGNIDREIERRYDQELQVRDYPHINSFLHSVFFMGEFLKWKTKDSTEASTETSTEAELAQLGNCGKGYYRFEIV